jgi:uncharacterized membrane protein HdeD (DUF308 family)
MTDQTGIDKQKVASTLMWEGIALIVLGSIAVILPGIFSLAVTTLVGVLLLVGGAIRLWRCLSGGDAGSHIWHILAAALAVIAGLLLLVNPVEGVLTLTVVVIALFLAEGVMKTIGAFNMRPANGWVWMMLSGLVDIVLGILLWSGLPGTAMWAIGLLVGISLLFTGWTAVMLAAGLKRAG